MDFPTIIAQVRNTASWLTPAALLVALFKFSWAKGHIGELLARFVAHRQSDEQTYLRLEGSTGPREAAGCAHPAVRLRGVFI